jgi:hypothetical protein
MKAKTMDPTTLLREERRFTGGITQPRAAGISTDRRLRAHMDRALPLRRDWRAPRNSRPKLGEFYSPVVDATGSRSTYATLSALVNALRVWYLQCEPLCLLSVSLTKGRRLYPFLQIEDCANGSNRSRRSTKTESLT